MAVNSTEFFRPRTLIADDQPDVLAALHLLLKSEGFQTETVTSPSAVLEALKERHFDILLMDLNYARDTTSGQEGLDLLSRVQALDSSLPIVVMTAWGTIDLAVEAMRRGVRDFVQKPWENARLLNILRTHIEQGLTLRKGQRLRAERKMLSSEMLEITDQQVLIKMAAEHIQRALQSRAVVVFTRTTANEAFEAASTVGLSDEIVGRLKFASECLLLKHMETIFDAREVDLSEDERNKLRRALAEMLVPIRLKGELLGFISLGSKITDEPFDEEDMKFLAAIGDALGISMDNLRLRGQDQEFQEARQIQQGLLPRTIPQIRGYEISGSWLPARSVSGDYYDVLKFNETKAALAVADVSGKGMPAALLMSNVQAAVKAFASAEAAPRELCEKVNRIICSNTASDRFITLFYSLLDSEAGSLVYTNAGHNAPILVRRDGSIVRLEEGGALLGPLPGWTYEQAEVKLGSGDRIMLYTDGVTEAINSKDEEFGEDRLISLLLKNRELCASELQDKILTAVADFSDGHFQDDATLIVISVE